MAPELRSKKTNRKKEIKRRKAPNKLTSKTPLEPGSSSTTKKNAPQDDHMTAKQKIKRQKTPKKLTSTTPLEPASSSTVNKNVWSEEDKLWVENVTKPQASFMLKPLQFPPDYDFHDHNICIAEQLGFDYGVPIPACYSKYFDPEAMVPVKPSPKSDSYTDFPLSSKSDSYTHFPFSLNPFYSEPSLDDSPSPPSDRDIMNLESNDAPIDLGGPMTRSKKKELDAAMFKQMLAFDSNPCEDTKQWLKRLDDLGFH